MAKNRYYAVWKGRSTGIFDSWDKCKSQVDGYEGAQYKGFPTETAAQAALKSGYWASVKRAVTVPAIPADASEKPIASSISVDAACSGNPGKLEYRGVETATGRELFRMGPFEQGTNNVGEFLAIVHGLAYLKKNGSSLPLYSDSVNAQLWVRAKKCKTKLEQTTKNNELFELIARAEAWLQLNKYDNKVLKWKTEIWGEIPADFGRK
jgi:ribonuclease HI